MTTSLFRFTTLLIFIFCLLTGPYLAVSLSASVPTVAEPAAVDLAAMTRLNTMSTLGVRATAYISALQQTAAAGRTHRVAVVFVNEKTGASVQKAQVGIKQRKLYGDASEPVWMHNSAEQPGIFVAELALKERGTYLLIVGSRLEDNKKRQFTFQFLLR